MRFAHLETPIGVLLLAGDRPGLREIRFPDEEQPAAPEPEWERDPAALEAPITQLRDYFAKRREHFDLQLEPQGTPFQLEVWNELARIPFGETISYSELAQRVGRPKAVRAVGAANGANPLPIVLPCHRVIGSNGSLVGYGGGLPIKRALLDLEQGGLLWDR